MKNQLIFLVWLRAFSSLIVLFYHLTLFFWSNNLISAYLAHSKPLLYENKFNHIFIDLGQLGVGVFFLISGFLMALIANGQSRKSFIMARLLRVYPSYIIALFITLTWIYFFTKSQGNTAIWYWEHLLASFFLIRDVFNYPLIDGIVWTLELEMKFYLICFIFLPWLINKPRYFLTTIFFIWIFSFLLYLLCEYFSISFMKNISYILTKSSKFFCFMTIGILISYLYQNKLSLTKIIVFLALMLFCFLIHTVFLNIKIEYAITDIISYISGLFIFIICYLCQNIFKKNMIISYFSETSYSLYLIHCVPSFIIIFYLIHHGYSVLLSISLAFIYSFIFAFVFYKFIEKPLLKIKSLILKSGNL